MKLTDEEKAHFAPMLQRTYEAIAWDVNCHGVEEIIEITCDANHPEMYSGMTREEYKVLCDAYFERDTQRWLRKVLNYEIRS